MINNFNYDELRWIRELVENEIDLRKAKGEYEQYTFDKEIFESILKKISKEL